MSDRVNHPAHYGGGDSPYEVIKIIEACNLGFCDGNVLKYLLRWRHKGGIEDLEKAQWYLDRFIQQQRRLKTQTPPSLPDRKIRKPQELIRR